MKFLPKSVTRFDLWVLAFMLFVRCVLLLYVYPDRAKIFNGDSARYEGLAVNFLQTGEYCFAEPGDSLPGDRFARFNDMIRPPAYPAFLMGNYLIFGERNLLAPILWNFLMIIPIFFGIKALLQRAGAHDTHFALLFFASDMAWLLFSKEILTEPIFTALLVWSVVWMIDMTNDSHAVLAIKSGIFLALATLMKPITLYFPMMLIVGFIPIFLWKLRTGSIEKRLRFSRILVSFGMTGIIFLLGISPWIIRNKLTHDTWQFTSIQGNNLLFGHVPYILSSVNNVGYSVAQDSVVAEFSRSIGNRDSAPFAELDSAKHSLAKKYLTEYPLIYAKTIIVGMLATLFDPGREVYNRTFPSEDVRRGFTESLSHDGLWATARKIMQKDAAMAISLTLYILFLCVVNFFAIAGIIPFARKNLPVFLLIFFVVGYLLLLGGPNGYARFRLYIFPFLLVFSQFGVEYFRRKFQRTIEK